MPCERQLTDSEFTVHRVVACACAIWCMLVALRLREQLRVVIRHCQTSGRDRAATPPRIELDHSTPLL